MGILRKFVRVDNDAKLGDRQIRIIASDATPDLAKDIMVPQGCDIENYRANPIILAQHDPNWPIAKSQVEIVNGRVEALIEFPEKGVSAKADEYCGLAKAGIINAASVGFEGLETEPIKGGGIRYNKWRLLEISLVSVPCNPSALVIARSAPAQTKADEKWKVGASRNLSIDEEESWDGPAAEASIFEHCNFDGDKPDTRFARKGFLVYDESAPTLKGSYKLPFAKVKDGRLVALASGVRAAASRLPQTDIPADLKEKARDVIDHYESKFSDDGKGTDKGASAMTIKSAAIITKGMYGVANLACMLEELGWATMSSQWEAEMEGDGSKVPGMLAEGLRQLADAFVAMSQEEVGELLASVATDGDKAARTKILKGLLPKARKAGRRFSQANQDHLDAIDKCTKALDLCREKMADIHDDTVGHTEELKGQVEEMKGHLQSMKGAKSADQLAAIDGMSTCADKMGNTCEKMAHLHDYLRDHVNELQGHVEDLQKHVGAMQGEDDEDSDTDDGDKKKPDDGAGNDDDDGNSDGELAFEIEQRKRALDLLIA